MCACRRWGGLSVVRTGVGLRLDREAPAEECTTRTSGTVASAVAAAATIARRTPLSGRTLRAQTLMVAAGCVVLAALSLRIARQPTYDPTAWLLWGREIVHGDLSTTSGPSWKPLPMLVTVPAALLGDGGQQDVWLIVARTGLLGAAVLACRLAWRLEGPVAGLIAAAALLLSSGYTSRTFRGDSEGLLVALTLGAVEAHLAGRRWVAFALLVGTALLRPEMWLFAGLYGLWLAVAGGPREHRARTVAIVAGTGAFVVAAWLVPEEIGSGRLLRAASRALEPVAGSPATASRPFVATFTNAAPVLPWPIYAGGLAYVAAAVVARRRAGRALALALAVIATALMVIVALMAEMGFTGNSRYLTVPIAITGILGGAGLVAGARLAWARLPRWPALLVIAVGAAVAAPYFATAVRGTRHQIRAGMRYESTAYDVLSQAIARAGGRKAVLACGPVVTQWFDVQTIARDLGVHSSRVTIHLRVPGTLVSRRYASIVDKHRYPVRLATTRRWVIASSCRR
jgi:hypothetical protein